MLSMRPLFCLEKVKRIIPREERELQTVRDGPRNPNFRPDVFEVRLLVSDISFNTAMFAAKRNREIDSNYS